MLTLGLAGLNSYKFIAIISHPHVVKRNASVLCKLIAEHRNLWIALTEVIQHYELCLHLYTTLNGLSCCTKIQRENPSECQ